MCSVLTRAMKGSSRKLTCSAGFKEVEYAAGRWAAGNIEVDIAEEHMDL